MPSAFGQFPTEGSPVSSRELCHRAEDISGARCGDRLDWQLFNVDASEATTDAPAQISIWADGNGRDHSPGRFLLLASGSDVSMAQWSRGPIAEESGRPNGPAGRCRAAPRSAAVKVGMKSVGFGSLMEPLLSGSDCEGTTEGRPSGEHERRVFYEHRSWRLPGGARPQEFESGWTSRGELERGWGAQQGAAGGGREKI